MSGAFDLMLVPRVVALHAQTLAGKAAIVEDSGATTYAALHDGAMQAANALRALGLSRGDRVAIAMQPSAAYVCIVLGAMAAGLVPAPVNTRLTAAEMAGYLRRVEPRLVLGDGGVDVGGLDARALQLDAGDPLRALASAGGGGSNGAAVLWPDAALDGAAIAFPTGGTTGLPKAAVWSHDGLALALISACMHLGVGRSDTELYFSPMYHLTLVTSLLAVLYGGGTVRLLPRFEEDAVLRVLREEQVTRFFGTPVVIERLLAAPGGIPTSALRSLVFGASRSAADFPARLQTALPGVRLMTGYGATEFGAICRVWPEEVLDPDCGVGRAVAGVTLTVRDRESGAPLRAGEIGEVAVRSPMQMLGYLGGETPRMVDGAILSGDLGELDAQGRLHLRGRISELIKTGGENVFPSEVEAVVVQHPSVFDAVVYGVEDSAWGERVECAVIVHPGAALDADALRTFCATQLGGYKVPKRFRQVAEFPRTSTLKLDRQALRRAALLTEQPA